MKLNIRTFLLKSLPYLMSIAGGIILYTGAIDNAPNANIRDLVINVSASLLSIPLVFLLYDYTNSRVARQMKKSVIHSMTDKLNDVLVNTIMMLRDAMGVRNKLSLENLNRMLVWRAPEIARRLNITPRVLDALHSCHNDLDTLLFRNSQTNTLTPDQVQILSSIARAMAHLINETKFHKNRHVSAKYVENIMGHILDWLDADSVAALNLAHHLTPPESIPGQGGKNKK
ncbi:MAG: hypothetical protein IKB05_05290 [Alphaproteobacteria bacterium]|nr:hypothetical protein [Alphaproteobacteria bacterium]MBR2393873.1 hypothetical protein [Alphaproteobacteria bacterium]